MPPLGPLLMLAGAGALFFLVNKKGKSPGAPPPPPEPPKLPAAKDENASDTPSSDASAPLRAGTTYFLSAPLGDKTVVTSPGFPTPDVYENGSLFTDNISWFPGNEADHPMPPNAPPAWMAEWSGQKRWLGIGKYVGPDNALKDPLWHYWESPGPIAPSGLAPASAILTDGPAFAEAKALLANLAIMHGWGHVPDGATASDPDLVAVVKQFEAYANALGDLHKAGIQTDTLRTDGVLDIDTYTAIMAVHKNEMRET